MATNPAVSRFRQPQTLLLLMAAAVPLSFATWQALINNFAHERAAFTGVEIGIMQSLREVPGFLSFAVVWLLLLVREQRLALLSLLLLGAGTAITGLFPSIAGIYITTVLMSVGYHYYETLQMSLSLQWISRERAPETLGRIIAVGSLVSIIVFGLLWLGGEVLSLPYHVMYLAGGGATMLLALACWVGFPQFPQPNAQHRHLLMRRRYWLYYALTFLSGARRQIFVVFAGFLMVERFGFDVGDIAALFLINAALNTWLAPRIGRLIGHVGERRALVFEYAGLVGVFTAYAIVDDATFAAALYVVDHLFFALAIALRTYFQKIADPADIAATAGVSFTINHIAAVVIPVLFGFLWLHSPAMVFLAGAAMAGASLLLALNVPAIPRPGNEVVIGGRPLSQAALEG